MTYGWQISFAENKGLPVAIRGGGTELGENLAAPAARSRDVLLPKCIPVRLDPMKGARRMWVA
jgi:hypothetical protein